MKPLLNPKNDRVLGNKFLPPQKRLKSKYFWYNKDKGFRNRVYIDLLIDHLEIEGRVRKKDFLKVI